MSKNQLIQIKLDKKGGIGSKLVSADTSKVDIKQQSKLEDSKFEEYERELEKFSKMRIKDQKDKLNQSTKTELGKPTVNTSMRQPAVTLQSFMEDLPEEEEYKVKQSEKSLFEEGSGLHLSQANYYIDEMDDQARREYQKRDKLMKTKEEKARQQNQQQVSQQNQQKKEEEAIKVNEQSKISGVNIKKQESDNQKQPKNEKKSKGQRNKAKGEVRVDNENKNPNQQRKKNEEKQGKKQGEDESDDSSSDFQKNDNGFDSESESDNSNDSDSSEQSRGRQNSRRRRKDRDINRNFSPAKLVDEDLYNIEDMIENSIKNLESVYKPKIFRHTALKNFLAKALAEMNPDLSLQGTTIEYFSELFVRYIFEKASFEYWKVKNNQVDYQGWPDPLKMDVMFENIWNSNYEHQLSFLYK
ncbi:UNKNOWN [Stylonychia lemnae]|uniref:Uncharacterized protein n=1 Tax=Stylonychia lemnae TaxID=5949 RepID=A0A078AB60_STYLE|nr:UNKNOWN [Stylonychia lemnae]|eukprot:CDW79121.1 UNKNOWN [Stylonychia lemnae]